MDLTEKEAYLFPRQTYILVQTTLIDLDDKVSLRSPLFWDVDETLNPTGRVSYYTDAYAFLHVRIMFKFFCTLVC